MVRACKACLPIYICAHIWVQTGSDYLRVARPVLRVQHSRHLRRTNLRVHVNCDDWNRNDDACELASEHCLWLSRLIQFFLCSHKNPCGGKAQTFLCISFVIVSAQSVLESHIFLLSEIVSADCRLQSVALPVTFRKPFLKSDKICHFTATRTRTKKRQRTPRPKYFKMKLNSPGVYVEYYNLIGANRSLQQNFDYLHHVIVISDWVRSFPRPIHPGWMAVSITVLTVTSVQICVPKCTISLWWLVGFGWFQKVPILIGLELKTVARDTIKKCGGGWWWVGGGGW